MHPCPGEGTAGPFWLFAPTPRQAAHAGESRHEAAPPSGEQDQRRHGLVRDVSSAHPNPLPPGLGRGLPRARGRVGSMPSSPSIPGPMNAPDLSAELDSSWSDRLLPATGRHLCAAVAVQPHSSTRDYRSRVVTRSRLKPGERPVRTMA